MRKIVWAIAQHGRTQDFNRRLEGKIPLIPCTNRDLISLAIKYNKTCISQ